MKISCIAGDTQTDNGGERYDGQVQRHTNGETDRATMQLTNGHTVEGHRWVYTYITTTYETKLHVFTFLQALMDEAMVLSVLPPSTSIDSEPSNMAVDWKLLRGKKRGTELTLSEQVLVKHSTTRSFKKVWG